ncbi:MAG: hypothetical protein ACR2MX_13380 [Cyclobacteriaceae bacterium]
MRLNKSNVLEFFKSTFLWDLLCIILLFGSFPSPGQSATNEILLKTENAYDQSPTIFRNSRESFYFRLDSKKRVTISLGLLLGFGSAEMDYDITSPAPGNTNSPVVGRNFATSYTNVQLQPAISYSYKNLALGGTVILTKTNATDGNQTFRREAGTSLLTRSLQNWPNGRTYYGFSAAYDFQLGEKVVIAPFFQYLWYNFNNDNSFVTNDQFADSSFRYNDSFTNRQSQGYGAVFKIALNQRFLLGVGAVYQTDKFDINKGFLLEEMANFKMSMNSFYMGTNVSMTLLK